MPVTIIPSMDPNSNQPYLVLQPSEKIFIDPRASTNVILSLLNTTTGNIAFKVLSI